MGVRRGGRRGVEESFAEKHRGGVEDIRRSDGVERHDGNRNGRRRGLLQSVRLRRWSSPRALSSTLEYQNIIVSTWSKSKNIE